MGRPGPTAHWSSKSAEGILVCVYVGHRRVGWPLSLQFWGSLRNQTRYSPSCPSNQRPRPYLPGLGCRYSMVLTSTSATALLVISTFCGESHNVGAIRCRGAAGCGLFCPPAGVRPTSPHPNPVWNPTFSISLKSSSSLVPSAPPTFSLTSCWVQGGKHERAQEEFLPACGGQLCLSRM